MKLKQNEIIDVSIILPVYNTQEYLKDCVESLLRQGNISFEIIAVNDGSTDNSLLILEEYKSLVKNFYVFTQRNKGQGAARNLALKHANGRYIYFMDSDDILVDDAMSNAISLLDKNKLDILFFDGDHFFDSTLLEEASNFQFNYKRTYSLGKFKKGMEIFSEFIKSGTYSVSPCLFITKKEMIIENEILFEEGIIHEDEIFIVKLLYYTRESMHINKVWFKRRIRPNSTMTSENYKKKIIGYLRALEKLDEFYFEKNINNSSESKIYKKNMLSIYSSIISINEKMKNEDIDYSNEFLQRGINIAKKHFYFNIWGFLMTKNYKLFLKLQEIKKDDFK